MILTVTRLSPDGRSLRTGGAELFEGDGPLWIDVQGADEPLLGSLAARFGLHKLAVEDCLHLDQRPKLEEYPGHHFLVMHGFAAPAADPVELTLHEVHMFIGGGWILSVHEHPSAAIDVARRRMEAEPGGTFARGTDFVAYVIADALVDGTFDVLDAFDEAIEELEERIFERPGTAELQRMFALKRALVNVRRVISPQRDVVALLTRNGPAFLQERTVLYFRDVYDHLVRLHEQLEAARDLLSNARDAWLSTTANRTGDITKQLTIIATIFLPLSFLVGFFGQNFDVLSRPVFFWLMLALCAAVPPALLMWFRHRRWI